MLLLAQRAPLAGGGREQGLIPPTLTMYALLMSNPAGEQIGVGGESAPNPPPTGLPGFPITAEGQQ